MHDVKVGLEEVKQQKTLNRLKNQKVENRTVL